MLPPHLIALILIAAVVVLAKLAGTPKGSELIKDKQVFAKFLLIVDSINRKHATAEQDKNPFLALVHNTEALSELRILSVLVTSSDAEQYLRVNLLLLNTKLLEQRRVLLVNLRAACPGLAIVDIYA